MMKKILLFISIVACAAGCNDKMPEADGDYTGLIITEVAANADKNRTDSWIEIYNSSSKEIALTGLDVLVSDGGSEWEPLTIMEGKTIRAGERLVFSTSDYGLIRGFRSDEDFEIVLGKSVTEGVVDRFSRAKDAEGKSTARFGSYQRIPEVGGDWTVTSQSTRRIHNYDAKPTGIWVWSTHMDQWMADDFRVLKELVLACSDVDLHEVLIYHAACTEVEVTYL